MILCRLTNILGITPSLAPLPQVFNETDPLGDTITVTVMAPTEAFATTNGYVAKAVMNNNGSNFLTMWWDGSGTASKGYLIQRDNPMLPDGMTRLRYAQWDRTTDNQVFKLYSTQFATSYLTSPTGSTSSTTGGDEAHYGRLTYNTSTQAATMQTIQIRAGISNDPSIFQCVRTAFTGIIGGTISYAYRPALGTPEAVTDIYTDGTDMDGVTNIIDSTTTPAGAGTHVSGSALTTGYFDYSCDDINAAASTIGDPFYGNTIDFSKDPSTIFPH
jgi:hypothetical protein